MAMVSVLDQCCETTAETTLQSDGRLIKHLNLNECGLCLVQLMI